MLKAASDNQFSTELRNYARVAFRPFFSEAPLVILNYGTMGDISDVSPSTNFMLIDSLFLVFASCAYLWSRLLKS